MEVGTMVKKKPTKEEDGKLVKEEPEEEEAEKAKKEVIKAESEKEACNDDKVKKAEEDEEEEEEEDELEEKKKKAKKGVQASVNPEESEATSNTDGHTLTPGLSVPSKPQDVFVPSSSVDGKREQSTPMGKSVSPDLLKSPLFIQITKQMDSMQDALTRKVDALQKSVEDRMKNIKSDMEKIEKFYSQSFYKAASDEVGPESLAPSFSKQLEEGNVRFRNK
jgi:hypothetical protein